jgi:peptidoglycan/xylan/chitin deacetylase (PgdA/CDA1 family)
MKPGFWPEGRSLAVSVNVMLEQWSDDVAPGLGPMGNPLRAGVLDTQARSWAAYGPNAGAWRILDVLAANGTKALFYVSGILAERHAPLIKAIHGAGHALACHGWAQEILPIYQSREDETRDLDRTAAAILAAAGVKPRGFLSPRCTPSASTQEILAERGYLWHADIFDADLPYRLNTPAGALVAVPFTMEINDLPMAVRYGNAWDAFPSALQFVLDGAAELAAKPACIDVTVHAHLFGRPGGALALSQALKLARRHDRHVFLTTHADLAAAFTD